MVKGLFVLFDGLKYAVSPQDRMNGSRLILPFLLPKIAHDNPRFRENENNRFSLERLESPIF